MILLHETQHGRIEPLTEQTSSGKKVYLEGPFLMAEKLNRNRRVYPRSVMERSVDAYIREYVNERRALGELNHPEYPFPDPKVACLITKSLSWDSDDVVGKAQILSDSVYGRQILALLDADFNLGVSSRGLGDVTERPDDTSIVNNFLLNAIDAVDLPSGQVCYVKPVNESVSWVEANGVWIREVKRHQPQAKPERLLEALEAMFMEIGTNLQVV